MMQKLKFWQDGWCSGGGIFKVCTSYILTKTLLCHFFMVFLSPTMEMGWVELGHVKFKMLFSLVGRLAA